MGRKSSGRRSIPLTLSSFYQIRSVEEMEKWTNNGLSWYIIESITTITMGGNDELFI